MKTLILTSILLTASLTSLFAQEHIVIPALSQEEFFALDMKDKNSTNTLPSLAYWGFKDLEWSSPVASTQAQSGKGSTLAGLAAKQELLLDPSTKVLSGVRHWFAQGITNRTQRLAQFRQIKAQLVDAYSAPSHLIKGDEIFRGQDAYVQGLDKEYRLEWHGPETRVSLVLSDEALFVEFRQASKSRAGEKHELVTRAREQRQLIQKRLQELARPSATASGAAR